MVSMVHDYAKNKIDWDKWTQNPSAVDDLKKIIKMLEKIDRKLGEPDCVDPEKAKFMDELEKLIKTHKESV